ncbi:MAG: D-glycerate dehydrogenase [Acidobacteria bacterium]|nr:D-glycerate dehydrogenase [Acidobacteriota bacterium]
MMKPRIFVTRRIPEKGLEMLRPQAEVEVWPDALPPDYPVLVERVQGIDALLCMLTDRIDGNLMDAAGSRLKVISQFAVGVDNIDTAAATERGIPVGNTPGVLTDTTADLAWALLMAAARRVAESDRFVRAGKWKTWASIGFLGQDIAGATLGIVGFGRIGRAVAERARGFGMRILYHSRRRHPEAERKVNAEFVGLDTLLRESDFVSLHTNLSEDTRHLMNEANFKKMKPGSVLINTARGPIVDSGALYRALSSGTIAYAALDVTEPEPLRPDDPLLALDNIVLCPHIGSASHKTRSRMSAMAAENLIAGLNGKRLPHCANPQVYDIS